MKPLPDADENRRLGDIESDTAEKLPAGSAKESHLKRARDHEASAHARDWRDSHLHAPIDRATPQDIGRFVSCACARSFRL
jgi:hypothetical protein